MKRRLTELETEVTTLVITLEKQQRQLRSLTGTVSQSKRGKKNGAEIPDPQTDPEGWKKYMAKQHVLNRS